MPKTMKTRKPASTQTRRLVHQAILYGRNRRGATYAYIKKYVNSNTTEPYVCDLAIKNSLRVGIDSKRIAKDGAFYKITAKRLPAETEDVKLVHRNMERNKRSSTKITNLHGWGKMIMILIGVFVFASLIVGAKAESDDEDDIVGEILFDLMTGFVLEMCTESATCGSFLTIIGVATILFGIVMTCVTGECFFECPTSRQVRRGATVYAGMRTKRWLD